MTELQAGLALKGLFIEWLCTRVVCQIWIKARSTAEDGGKEAVEEKADGYK